MNALDTLARLRLADGCLWIDAAVDFQLEDARAVLSGSPPYNFLTRARGASKTGDLSAVALALLLEVEVAERLYWLAADGDQGGLAIDAIAGYVSRTPGLAGQVEVLARKVKALASGATIEVLPADAPGAWGLNPYAVFVDELANWADGPAARRLWEAASSAVAKRDDARLVVLTTAGSPEHFAREVLDHAEGSPLWRVHEVHGPAPWADPERIAEQRVRLPDSVYRQLFENQWVAAEGAFLDPAVVDAAIALDGPGMAVRSRSYVAALDLGAVNDRTVVAIGHREGDAEVYLDRMQTWKGSRRRPVDFEEIERYIVEAHRAFRFDLQLDPWQGLDLAQRLRKQGIRATEFNFSQGSKQRLAATLLHSLNAGHLRLYEPGGLRDELVGLRLKQAASGAWSFDHSRRGHDDRAVALALMTVAALERSTGTITSCPSPFESKSAFRKWQAEQERKQAAPRSPVIPTSPPPPERAGKFLIRPR